MDGTQDPNVKAVQAKLAERAEKGLKTYGVDTTRKDYGEVAWLKELQTELLDAAVYIEALLSRLSLVIEQDMRKHYQDPV